MAYMVDGKPITHVEIPYDKFHLILARCTVDLQVHLLAWFATRCAWCTACSTGAPGAPTGRRVRLVRPTFDCCAYSLEACALNNIFHFLVT